MQFDLQLRVAGERCNEGVSRAAALAMAVHELIKTDAALAGAVEVMVEGQAQRLYALHEPARHLVDVPRVRHQQRASAAMQFILQAVVAFHAAKMRQHILPAPAWIIIAAAQQIVPLVIIRGPPAHIDLGIHRRAATQHIALRNVVHAAIEMVLRHRLVIAHELRAIDHLEDARRHVEQRMPVRVAAFEKQYAGTAIVHQPRGGNTPRRSAAHHDVIITLFHV